MLTIHYAGYEKTDTFTFAEGEEKRFLAEFDEYLGGGSRRGGNYEYEINGKGFKVLISFEAIRRIDIGEQPTQKSRAY